MSKSKRNTTAANKAKKPMSVVAGERRDEGEGARQDRRQATDRRQKTVPVAFERRVGERRLGERRRQVDPTTCERDYTEEEIAFMKAIDEYKRDFARPFPTWSEVLEVLKSMGYRKVAEPIAIVQNRAKAAPMDDDI